MKWPVALAAAFALLLVGGGACNPHRKDRAEKQEHPRRYFHLYVNDGEWKLADGKTTYIVSYVAWNEHFDEAPAGAVLPPPAIPAPTIRVRVGDEVHVILHNSGHHHLGADSSFANVTHTIHFHGLDLVQAYDGVPGLTEDGFPAAMRAGVPVGQTFEYKFVPRFEGSYMYHCHVDTSTHALLGMYGAFIVDGTTPNTIYGKHYDREYTLFFSELDSRHNDAIHDTGDYDMMKWKTDYFMINGRIFTADLTNPLSTATDPHSRIKAKEGQTILLRLLAIGWDHTFAFHPHAYHLQVVGSDGRPLDAPYWKDTLPIVSGERYDVLVPVQGKKDAICLSCRMGKGLSIAHDHNLRGQASSGRYPRGAVVVFEIN